MGDQSILTWFIKTYIFAMELSCTKRSFDAEKMGKLFGTLLV